MPKKFDGKVGAIRAAIVAEDDKTAIMLLENLLAEYLNMQANIEAQLELMNHNLAVLIERKVNGLD